MAKITKPIKPEIQEQKVYFTVHHNLETQKTILPFLATPAFTDTKQYKG